jgi:hypothetical protein
MAIPVEGRWRAPPVRRGRTNGTWAATTAMSWSIKGKLMAEGRGDIDGAAGYRDARITTSDAVATRVPMPSLFKGRS